MQNRSEGLLGHNVRVGVSHMRLLSHLVAKEFGLRFLRVTYVDLMLTESISLCYVLSNI